MQQFVQAGAFLFFWGSVNSRCDFAFIGDVSFDNEGLDNLLLHFLGVHQQDCDLIPGDQLTNRIETDIDFSFFFLLNNCR